VRHLWKPGESACHQRREGTLGYLPRFKRPALTRDQLLGIDVTTVTKKTSNGKLSEEFFVLLRSRDETDQEQLMRLAQYDEKVDADALADWLREKLGLPSPTGPAEA
jgi:hypothetical protein